jgi:RNA recognition motif-containing protein
MYLDTRYKQESGMATNARLSYSHAAQASNTIVIYNLSEKLKTKFITDIFAQHGRIEKFRIIPNARETGSNMAFLEYEYPSSVQKSIDFLSNRKLGEMFINIVQYRVKDNNIDKKDNSNEDKIFIRDIHDFPSLPTKFGKISEQDQVRDQGRESGYKHYSEVVKMRRQREYNHKKAIEHMESAIGLINLA